MSKKQPVLIPYEFGITNDIRKLFDDNEIYHDRVEELKDLVNAEELIDIFGHYVRHCIPSPVALEDDYWMCSCFPGNYNIPIRINIYWHEVFRIQEAETSAEDAVKWEIMVYTDKQILDSAEFRKLKQSVPDVWIDEHLYYPKGLDSQQAIMISASDYFACMEQDSVLESIKQYNYQLMQKGRRVHNGHNHYLATLAF